MMQSDRRIDRACLVDLTKFFSEDTDSALILDPSGNELPGYRVRFDVIDEAGDEFDISIVLVENDGSEHVPTSLGNHRLRHVNVTLTGTLTLGEQLESLDMTTLMGICLAQNSRIQITQSNDNWHTVVIRSPLFPAGETECRFNRILQKAHVMGPGSRPSI
jgi:hypothetical protein